MATTQEGTAGLGNLHVNGEANGVARGEPHHTGKQQESHSLKEGRAMVKATQRIRQRKMDLEKIIVWTRNVLLSFMGVGVLALLLYSLHYQSWAPGVRTFSLGLLFAISSVAAGSLCGFLFGIPRTPQLTEAYTPAGPVDSHNGDAHRYRENTNLEQISDWLTKILVGVGLTQFSLVLERFNNLVSKYGAAFEDPAYGPTLALALVVYFVVCGFFFGYLMTRLFLTGAFSLVADAQTQELEARTEETAVTSLEQKSLPEKPKGKDDARGADPSQKETTQTRQPPAAFDAMPGQNKVAPPSQM